MRCPDDSATVVPEPSAFDHLGRQHVHPRRTDETGHEEVGGVVIQIQRRPDLLDAAGLQHDDLVGHRHGFDLIVRDIDHGRVEFLVQARQFDPHLAAQGGVEVGQRFVEQEDLGLPHDRTADGDTLALTTRQVPGPTVEVGFQLQDASGFLDLAVAFGPGNPRQAQSEPHVLPHRHVRIQRVGLEHHRQAAVRRPDLIDPVAVDLQFARGDFLQSRDHAQQCRLAAARWSDEHNELAVGDGEINALDDLVQSRSSCADREGSGLPCTGSLFYSAESQALHELTLAEPAEHQDGCHRHRRRG